MTTAAPRYLTLVINTEAKGDIPLVFVKRSAKIFCSDPIEFQTFYSCTDVPYQVPRRRLYDHSMVVVVDLHLSIGSMQINVDGRNSAYETRGQVEYSTLFT